VGSHVWHLFVIQAEQRDALRQYLHQHGVQTLLHYPLPVYRHPPYSINAPKDESISDRLTKRVISLPMGPHLCDADIQTISDIVGDFFRK
jgi:dTDP-4-amino-4,6-dideoxygalactose transaminase